LNIQTDRQTDRHTHIRIYIYIYIFIDYIVIVFFLFFITNIRNVNKSESRNLCQHGILLNEVRIQDGGEYEDYKPSGKVILRL
jgi:hypothetical protein